MLCYGHNFVNIINLTMDVDVFQASVVFCKCLTFNLLLQNFGKRKIIIVVFLSLHLDSDSRCVKYTDSP